VLLIDSPSSSVSDRVKWAEILFEGYRAPSLCIGNSASLSIFAAGRTTGVVVDCGAGVTTSVPVFEGLALTHACTSMEMGGMDVTTRLQKLLKERAGCSINLSDALILKERLAFVNLTPPLPLSKLKSKAKGVADVATKVVESQDDDFLTVNLPDGREVKIETRYFGDCSEQLISNTHTTFNGLSGQVCESLVLCDDSIRKDLARNIIISGGTSMLPGLGARLEKDLDAQLRQRLGAAAEYTDGAAAFVYPSAEHRESGYTQQRKHAAWVGGSIFASFDSFKQLRVTKQEWEESAEAALLTKCF
jgi:actin-related protein